MDVGYVGLFGQIDVYPTLIEISRTENYHHNYQNDRYNGDNYAKHKAYLLE